MRSEGYTVNDSRRRENGIGVWQIRVGGITHRVAATSASEAVAWFLQRGGLGSFEYKDVVEVEIWTPCTCLSTRVLNCAGSQPGKPFADKLHFLATFKLCSCAQPAHGALRPHGPACGRLNLDWRWTRLGKLAVVFFSRLFLNGIARCVFPSISVFPGQAFHHHRADLRVHN